MKIEEIRRALSGKLWMMHGPKLTEMLMLLELDRQKFLESFKAEQDLRAARTRLLGGGTSGAVAVVPLYGVVSHRGSMWASFFGGAAVEDITQQLRQAAADPGVKAIVMDVDSPGGDVEGIDELATEIYQARKQKPITAVSNSMCASAAYYLASQANELLVSPSSLTGSIGVYTVHEDYSGALDNAGIKVSMLKFGENKGEGNPYEPLSDPAREHMQEMVDTFGGQFEKAVARGRKTTQDEVHKKFGQGRVFDAKKAVALGMADRVATFDEALAKHGAARSAGARMVHDFGARALVSVSHHADGTLTALFAAEKKTKRVDGEDLEKPAFAYQGEDLADWKLPIKFSTEEKTKSHIRNAISRWGSTDMPDAEEKSRARGRIKSAAKAHGIDVDDESLASAKKADEDDVGDPYNSEGCTCKCAECKDGSCKACSCENCACDGCACDMAAKARKTKSQMLRRRLDLAAA